MECGTAEGEVGQESRGWIEQVSSRLCAGEGRSLELKK